MEIKATGCPVLDECLAYIDCKVWARFDVGDHTLFVGEVQEAALSEIQLETAALFCQQVSQTGRRDTLRARLKRQSVVRTAPAPGRDAGTRGKAAGNVFASPCRPVATFTLSMVPFPWLRRCTVPGKEHACLS